MPHVRQDNIYLHTTVNMHCLLITVFEILYVMSISSGIFTTLRIWNQCLE